MIINYTMRMLYLILIIKPEIKGEWMEIPQFSHNQKIYRLPSKFHQIHQIFQDEQEKFVSKFPSMSDNHDNVNISFHQRIHDTFENTWTEVPPINNDWKKQENLFMNNTTIVSHIEEHQSKNATTGTSANLLTDFKSTSESEGYNSPGKNQQSEFQFINPTTKFVVDGRCRTSCKMNESRRKFSLKSTTLYNHQLHEQQQDYGPNKITTETDKDVLHYLPMKLLQKVHLILNSQSSTPEGKMAFLKNLEKLLLTEIQSKLRAAISPLAVDESGSKRKRRYDHHEEESLGFPSLEGALLSISFLAFAVYLVRLIMMLFHSFHRHIDKATILIGRKKRSMDNLNEDLIRILQYLDK